MKKNILFVLLTVLLSSCFELDNYDAPNAGINGSLIDSETGEVVYTEQPDGCRIKLLDLGYKDPTPLYFWAKANGTFRNVALFGGDYKVSPIEGPFFPVAEEELTLKGVTDHNFKVTPKLVIKLPCKSYSCRTCHINSIFIPVINVLLFPKEWRLVRKRFPRYGFYVIRCRLCLITMEDTMTG